MKDYELAAVGVAAYFILKGMNKLPGVATQIYEVASVDSGNAVLGLTNLFGLTNTTYTKNEWGEGTGTFTTTPTTPIYTGGNSFLGGGTASLQNNAPIVGNPVSAATYYGFNAWGDGQAILNTTQLTNGDWIQGWHLW